MLTRIFMTVRRGMTDATAVCVYPWEKPILEEIHGPNAEVKTLDEMCDIKGFVKVEKLRFKHSNEEAPGLRQQYEAMMKIDPEYSPLSQPEVEWDRLMTTYGMHPRVNLYVAEKVFGSFNQFHRAIREYAAGRDPDALNVEPGAAAPDEEKPLADMDDAELIALAKAKGIKTSKRPRHEIEAELLDLKEKEAA